MMALCVGVGSLGVVVYYWARRSYGRLKFALVMEMGFVWPWHF